MLRRFLVLALVGLAGCPKPDCPCEDKVFAFEVAGSGENMVVTCEGGSVIEEITLDLEDCACADQVKLRLTNTDGNLLDPPAEGECVLEAPSKRATTIELALALGDMCELDWLAIDTQPPVPIPIKVRP